MSQNIESNQSGVQHESGLQALQASPAFRSPVESIDGRESNEHLALLYEDQDEQFAAVVPYIRQGLERGERCMYVAHDNSPEEVREALRAGGVDVEAAVESGALSIHTVGETYLRDGEFDPDDGLAFLEAAIEDATEEFEGFRVTVEETWLGDDPARIERFAELEARVNDVFHGADCIALCQYNRARLPTALIEEVVETHPYLVHDGTVCENFYYTPPAEYFGPDRPAREIDRKLETLTDRTDARATLQTRERYRERLSAIASDGDLEFDEKVERFLALGRDRLGVEVGMLTREHADSFEIRHLCGTHPDLGVGTFVTPLEDGYCRQVSATGETVTVADTGAVGWSDDALYREFDLQCYAGVPVTVGDEFYGTVSFLDTAPREREFTTAERQFLELLSQWVGYELDRRRREDNLAALNDVSRELMDAETVGEIGEAVVAAAETLGLPVAAVALYDDGDGTLRPAAATDAAADLLEVVSPFEVGDSAGWEAFVQDAPRRVREPLADADSPRVTELALFPIGNHGVFAVGSAGTDGFDRADLDFAEMVAATARAACDRAARERLLQEREQTLTEQNEALERLNRVNDIIRDIDKALVGASTRGEIERAVCERLTAAGPYELAWVGVRDPTTDEVLPREWAGSERGYLEEITVTADDEPTGRGPAGRALRSGEPQVVNDVLEDESFAPWRQAALNRGYHACIALPLSYQDSMYGVLAVYAGQPGVFDDLERAVLAELSDTIAHAINAVESKKALVSDEVTELEFDVGNADLGFVDLARTLDCTVELESVVPRADEGFRAFFSTRGAPPEDVLAFADRLAVTDLTLVSRCTEGEQPFGLFEATPAEDGLLATVLDHGGRPRALVASDGVATVAVELAADAAVREFVEMFRANYPGSELIAQRDRERPQRTPAEFFAALSGELTARQFEALQTAYFSGYFDQPRRRTGSEIAEDMGITQPTFTTHLRTAVRKLCRQLFETN